MIPGGGTALVAEGMLLLLLIRFLLLLSLARSVSLFRCSWAKQRRRRRMVNGGRGGRKANCYSVAFQDTKSVVRCAFDTTTQLVHVITLLLFLVLKVNIDKPIISVASQRALAVLVPGTLIVAQQQRQSSLSSGSCSSLCSVGRNYGHNVFRL